jgi:hypothetical protein
MTEQEQAVGLVMAQLHKELKDPDLGGDMIAAHRLGGPYPPNQRERGSHR